MNPNLRKYPSLRRFPAQIHGSHVHRFADNARLGARAFGPGPQANLPVAIEIPNELTSFREFLRLVSAEFNIDGVEGFDPPNWQVMI
jgi:hypothetical protein